MFFTFNNNVNYNYMLLYSFRIYVGIPIVDDTWYYLLKNTITLYFIDVGVLPVVQVDGGRYKYT